MATTFEQLLAEFSLRADLGFLVGASGQFCPKSGEKDVVAQLMARLPMAIAKGNVRQSIELACQGLPGDYWTRGPLAEREHRFAQLSFLVAAYAREDPRTWPAKSHKPPEPIPAYLAGPLIELAKALGMEPIVCYASTVTFNVRLVDEHSFPSLDNLEIVNTFTGSVDEQWFYILGAAIELLSPQALHLGWQILLTKVDDSDILYDQLAELIAQATALLKRMYDNNDGGYFFGKIRHYLAGWHNDRSVGAGKRSYITPLVSVDMSQLAGASAAQSPTIQLFDAIVGVEHADGFLRDMQRYMPSNQRNCLLWFQRRFAKFYQCHAKVKDSASVRRCREALLAFRKTHWHIVQHYIISRTQPASSVIGTGGTDAIALLKTFIDETS